MKSLPGYLLRGASLLAALPVFVAPLLAQDQPSPAPSAAAASQDQAVVLDPFAVSATQSSDSYGAVDSSSGSRIALPIVDVPFSLVVVPRTLMDDMDAYSYVDALQFVSGMNAGSNVKNGDMVIRGLEVRSTSFSLVDGLDWGYESLQENAFIDRYEVVKGPAGTLYGDYSVGGLVNRIYKEPTATPENSVKVDWNSFGREEAIVDSSGPLPLFSFDKQLQYRVVALIGNGKEVTNGPDDRHGIYAALQFIPKGGGSKLWVHLSFEHFLYVTDDFDAIQDASGGLSMNYGFSARTSTAPGPTSEESDQHYFEFGAEHTTKSENLGTWTSRFVMRYVANDNDHDVHIQNVPTAYTFLNAAGAQIGTIAAAPNSPAVGNPTFAGSPWKDLVLSSQSDYWNPTTFYTYSFNYDLTGQFNTGPLSHDLLLYSQVHYYWTKNQIIYMHMLPQYGGSTGGGGNNFNPATAYSLVHPGTWAGIPESFADYAPFTPLSAYANGDSTNTTSISTQYNAGIQDNIFALNRRILLVGGARYDYISNQGVINNYTSTEGLGTSADSLIYKGSLVIKPFPNPGISIFANYTQTFTPEYGLLNPNITGDTQLYKNLLGLSKEIGAKVELLNSHLVGTVSIFKNQLDNNVVFYLDQASGKNINVQGGTALFPGWEGDLTYVVNQNWTALIAMSDVHSVQPNEDGFRNAEIGMSEKGVVRYSFSPDSALRGTALGLAVMHVPERYGSNTNYYNVAGYTELDSFLTYNFGSHWRFQANFNNMTNVKAILSAVGQLTNNVAVYPFNSDISLTFKF